MYFAPVSCSISEVGHPNPPLALLKAPDQAASGECWGWSQAHAALSWNFNMKGKKQQKGGGFIIVTNSDHDKPPVFHFNLTPLSQKPDGGLESL